MKPIAINEVSGIARDPDSDILPALIAQDQRAFAALMDRHIRSLSALSAQMLSDVHLAEDITQSVFLKTWQMLPTWQTGNAKLITWMRRVAKNRFIRIVCLNAPDLKPHKMIIWFLRNARNLFRQLCRFCRNDRRRQLRCFIIKSCRRNSAPILWN